MITFSISNGDKFNYPYTLEDITLQQYIDFITLVEPTKPKVLKDIDLANEKINQANDKADTKELDKAQKELDDLIKKSLDDLVISKYVHPYYARVVSFFSNLDEAYILGKGDSEGMNVSNLTYLYLHVINLLNDLPEVEYTPVIEVNDELWYLPTQYMKDSTVIEFAESSQFQHLMKNVEAGEWKAMVKIMCVLVRKKDEKYTESLLKRESQFLQWNLLNVWKVAFFLLRHSEKSQINSAIYTNIQRLTKLKRELAFSQKNLDGILQSNN
jgi:hypothetical protein